MRVEVLAACPLVFCDSEGNPLAKANFNRWTWYRLQEKLELQDVRFHDLRRSSASVLLKAGVYPKIVQERLEHSTIKLTLDTYRNILEGLQEQAADAMQVAFGSVENWKSGNVYGKTTFDGQFDGPRKAPSPQNQSQQRVL